MINRSFKLVEVKIPQVYDLSHVKRHDPSSNNPTSSKSMPMSSSNTLKVPTSLQFNYPNPIEPLNCIQLQNFQSHNLKHASIQNTQNKDKTILSTSSKDTLPH